MRCDGSQLSNEEARPAFSGASSKGCVPGADDPEERPPSASSHSGLIVLELFTLQRLLKLVSLSR